MDIKDKLNNNNFNVIMSIGIRCFTEIYLKNLNYKNFSSPFDALYLRKVDDIIELLENNIDYSLLLHTEDMKNDMIIDKLNKKHGYRSIYLKFKDNNTINSEHLYHSATFAHHNLKNEKPHFDRCFERLNIIKVNNIKTLFCLFLFPFYTNKYAPYENISIKDIYKLEQYLVNNYNCKLLVIIFTNNNTTIIEDRTTLMYINIKYKTMNFIDYQLILKNIFDYNKVDIGSLLNYKEIYNINNINNKI